MNQSAMRTQHVQSDDGHRMRRPSERVNESPSKQLARFIAKFDPDIARLTRAARRVLRARFRSGNELVYDNYNALAIGWSPTERASDVVVSLAVYASGVNLYFMQGARLADPGGILNGAGRQGRFVRLSGVADLERPEIRLLLAAASRLSPTPTPATGVGRTIIKSISARQRPRRAAPRTKRGTPPKEMIL